MVSGGLADGLKPAPVALFTDGKQGFVFRPKAVDAKTSNFAQIRAAPWRFIGQISSGRTVDLS
jgi:hypothetical protein